MYRRTFEHAQLQSLSIAISSIVSLRQHAHTLNKEDEANEWQQQFLVNDDSRHSYDAADCQ